MSEIYYDAYKIVCKNRQLFYKLQQLLLYMLCIVFLVYSMIK